MIFTYCGRFKLFLLEAPSICRSRWPHGIRHGSAASRFMGNAVSNPTWGITNFYVSVSSSRGFCVGLITRLEESYRVWCV